MTRDWRPIEVPYFRLDEAADVLARAFADDRAVAMFVPQETPERLAALRQLFKASCMARLSAQQPLHGAEWDNKIVAVACVKTTYTPAETETMKRMWARVAETVGAKGMEAIHKLVELREKNLPPRKHHYLTVLGVDPDYQSMGFGKALLETVVEKAREDPTSAGVMLETDGDKNAVFYERSGFKTTAVEKLDGLNVHFMYRAIR